MKISIIGAGSVGGQLANNLALKNYENIVLVDIAEGMACGKALDIMQSSGVSGFKGNVVGGKEFSLIEESEIVVVTAGRARGPGMSREDLLKINANIIRNIASKIKGYAPEAKVILVTNPLDIMAYLTYIETGFSSNKVMGMAGVLDTARYRYFISLETGVSVNVIEAMILGPHGDSMIITDMVKVDGEPLEKVLSQNKIEELKNRAKNAGKEVVQLLKAGSAFFAPAASITEMIESIVYNKKNILPCSVYPEGKYGLGDIFIGLPVRLGKNGVEEVVEVSLSDSNRKQLIAAAKDIEDKIKTLK